nr:PREDICTED: putative gustatory receptor 28b [Tribolium castaneum]|eukprot:XP_015837601.1 PREDICTED: putative gustatory receptor 28b [Tribolium castaneum]
MVYLISDLFDNVNKKLSTINNTRKILRLHQILCEICRSLNKVLSLQLLFLIGTHFKIIFINAFLLYADFGTNMQLASLYIGSAVCIKLYFCVYVSNRCLTQANLVKRSAFYLTTHNKNYKLWKEIHAFMLQLQHEYVNFEAGGFFPVNYTLLFSVFSASSTYVIIIIQCMNTPA